MTNEELYQELKNEFLTTFPEGWCGGHAEKDYISFAFGLIGERAALTSNILENDPMFHRLFISAHGAQLEATASISGISINPTERYLAMSHMKTNFRKTSGDHTKILKTFKIFFGRLKVLVAENESNIYQRSKYADKFFK